MALEVWLETMQELAKAFIIHYQSSPQWLPQHGEFVE
jgi:hypothetical protein